MAKLTKVTSDEIEEWSALYVDGKLDTVGDHYLIDDRIIQLTGVEEIEGNFLLGGNSYSDAAQTLDEITAYEVEKDEAALLELQAAELIAKAKNEAAVLELQAAELIAKAKELRGQ